MYITDIQNFEMNFGALQQIYNYSVCLFQTEAMDILDYVDQDSQTIDMHGDRLYTNDSPMSQGSDKWATAPVDKHPHLKSLLTMPISNSPLVPKFYPRKMYQEFLTQELHKPNQEHFTHYFTRTLYTISHKNTSIHNISQEHYT